MRGRKLILELAAAGLVIANVVVVGVLIAGLLVARRAWDLRESALAAAAQARAAAAATVCGRPSEPTVHAPVRRLRATTMDRILVFGILGAAGSAYFTYLLVARAKAAAQLADPRRARGHASRIAST
jgi:hypothetical protein